MGASQKEKGKRAERELCKLLGEILGGNFERIPNSGAFVGGKNQHRLQEMTETQAKLSKADLITPDHLPKMVIESKHYADLPLHNLLKPVGVKTLDGWITDLEHDCGTTGIGFICFKLNNKGWFVCTKQINTKDMTLGNHSVYNGYIVADFHPFFKDNKDEIISLCQ